MSNSIGIKGRAIVWSHAEPCMDVDKPHQLELMCEDLGRRQQEEAAEAAPIAEGSKPKKASPKKASPVKKTASSKTVNTKSKGPAKKKIKQ